MSNVQEKNAKEIFDLSIQLNLETRRGNHPHKIVEAIRLKLAEIEEQYQGIIPHPKSLQSKDI